MGDTYNLIIVKPAENASTPETIRDPMGFGAAIHAYPSRFRRCGFNLWLAEVGNSLVIDCPDAWRLTRPTKSGERLHKKGQELLERITSLFPDSEIAALYFDSRVGHYGYSVFNNGGLIRCNSGVSGERAKTYGSKLPFEEHYLSSTYKAIDKDGLTLYALNTADSEEEMPESAIGEELADELFRAYMGCNINSADMANVVGVGFLENQLKFDPQSLVTDPKPRLSRSSRYLASRQSLSLRGALLVFAALFLVWAILIAAR
jgi:hypothetical protein